MKQQELEDRLLKFGVEVVKMTKQMPGNSASVNLIRQIVRSATAPALMYGEACAAESPKDFAHKMTMALKELRETKMSLRMILMNDYAPEQLLSSLIDENDQLIRIFWKSIDTTKRNRLR
jgi:four helix bundle protein